MPRLLPRICAILLAVLTPTACRSALQTIADEEQGAAFAAIQPGVARNRDILPVEEIRAIAARSAYEVVVRLRPEFLGRRPTEYNDFEPPRSPRSALESADRTGDRYPTVFLNGTEQGGPAALQTIPASVITEIRFYPKGRVPVIYGSDHSRGVIDVRTTP